jgi:hypothetical protein
MAAAITRAAMREPETTARIRRDDLKELLDLEAPAPKQRTTAKMPAVTLTGLLCLRDEDLLEIPEPPKPPAPPRVRPQGTQREVHTYAMRPLTPPPSEGMVVRFKDTPASGWPLDRWPVSLIRARRAIARMPRPLIIAFSASATLVIARLVSLL